VGAKRESDTGLRKTVEWYLDHMDWVEAIQQKPGYQAWMKTNYSQRGAVKK
jgi:dTDP-glucose 4,6-dehydratase